MCALRSACEYFDYLLHLCSWGSGRAEMEHKRQRESSNSPDKYFEASSSFSGTSLRKCSSMYEKTNTSTNHFLKKCWTSTDMPVENDFDLAHIIARPDVSLLKRRESERTLPTSALAQLFNSNQRKAGENSRILLNITMRGSPGALKVIVGSQSDRTQVMKQALAVYAREGRLPVLRAERAYELYCGHDMSTAVRAEQQIGSLGYRNFLMCPSTATLPSTRKHSSKEHAEKTNTTAFFMSYYVHITM